MTASKAEQLARNLTVFGHQAYHRQGECGGWVVVIRNGIDDECRALADDLRHELRKLTVTHVSRRGPLAPHIVIV